MVKINKLSKIFLKPIKIEKSIKKQTDKKQCNVCLQYEELGCEGHSNDITAGCKEIKYLIQ